MLPLNFSLRAALQVLKMHASETRQRESVLLCNLELHALIKSHKQSVYVLIHHLFLKEGANYQSSRIRAREFFYSASNCNRCMLMCTMQNQPICRLCLIIRLLAKKLILLPELLLSCSAKINCQCLAQSYRNNINRCE